MSAEQSEQKREIKERCSTAAATCKNFGTTTPQQPPIRTDPLEELLLMELEFA